jgi:outer membrane protein W
MKRVLLVIALAFLPTLAFAQVGMLDVTARAVWADPSGEGDFQDSDADFDLDTSEGYGLGVNIRFGDRISTEFAAAMIESDATLESGTVGQTFNLGQLEMIPITGTLQFHLLGGSRIDPYIGGGVAYVLFDELSSDDLRDIDPDIEAIDFEDDIGYTANAGITFNILSGMGINLDAKWIKVSSATVVRETSPTVEPEEVEIDIDPLLISAGINFRF